MKWSVTAPANIALIKYMGKVPGSANVPLNSSLSYTLPHLLSYVELEETNASQDHWEPYDKNPLFIPHIFSTQAQLRFLKHLQFIKKQFNYSGSLIVRSANNFPHSAGLASSASSFAALTQVGVLACAESTGCPIPTLKTQAELSRIGSGSSCRSFFSPWSVWNAQGVEQISIAYPTLIHQVILIHTDEKKVSSSEAHQRVSQLPDFQTRITRAEARLKDLLSAFQHRDWKNAYQICWQEFQDMHALFERCKEPFTYITSKTQMILDELQNTWLKQGDGPLITMDAGPNIHLLFRPDQTAYANWFKLQARARQLHVLSF